jgi:glycosyltransferase involved in cell wall biosynthesis
MALAIICLRWFVGAEMAEQDKKILVCIPAFNESKTIAEIISKSRCYATEVLVCDDGSRDGTDREAEGAGAIVIRHSRNKGYGATIKTLFEAAKDRDPDVMITIDSDGQHDPDRIPEVVKPILIDGYDIVIGSRFLNDTDREQVPSFRGLGLKIITALARRISYSGITDAQNGFRAYSKNALNKMQLSENGMSVSTEILIKAKQENLSITEVPVTVNYNIENTSTHNSLSHGMSIIYSIMQFVIIKHPMLFIGLPGLALMMISAVLISQALDLFATTRYVSTPLILLSTGSAIIGIIMLLTSILIYAIKILMSKRID